MKTFTLNIILLNSMLTDSIINMTIGMIVGMAVSPVMMKGIKSIRQSLRVNRILREIENSRVKQWIYKWQIDSSFSWTIKL